MKEKWRENLCVHTCASSISNYSHSVILVGISGTFSLHRVWQQGNTSALRLFTPLSRPLISADSQSAPTQRAQVHIKRACVNLQVMWVQGRVWFPLGKEKKKKKHGILSRQSSAQIRHSCCENTRAGGANWQGQGKAPQHLSLNPERQVVEEQDKDKCLSVTGLGSADIFLDI